MNSEIARILFYMAVHYGDSGEINLDLNNQVNNRTNPYHRKLEVLPEWNELSPVDTFERNRNATIYNKYQYNRSPFIDHQEWASSIWQ
ncbi:MULTISPECIES: endonuclease [unclassified Peribacillus]|uniref:endonuclease n=1 Tax=unclassified Peribacillus TaxID=2675266 RepID=UPI001912D608|nr:endonuclease [Peribacillus sp. TH24]MBK5461548.1 endonuclease [Peribacillus sp. TH27]